MASAQQSNTTKVATVHLQKLESQVTELTRERDQLAEKMDRISHEYTLQSNAMGNLNGALESFQGQKENEMRWAEKDFEEKYAIYFDFDYFFFIQKVSFVYCKIFYGLVLEIPKFTCV